MTGWCGAQGPGWSPWRVVGHEFENRWAVSMQNEIRINGTTAVLRLPNTQVGPGWVLGCLWILWEDIECILLAFGCPDCCAGKDGEKILVLLLEQVLEPGKKWSLPLTLVLAQPVLQDQSLTIHLCLISVMRPLLNPWSPARCLRHWKFAYWVSGLRWNNQSSSRTDQHS